MTDFKTVLMFISFSLRPFLVYFGFHLFYFFGIITLTIPLFFIGFRVTEGPLFFWVYLGLLVPVGFFLERRLFYTRRLHLGILFVRFLDGLRVGATEEAGGNDAEAATVNEPPLPKNAFLITSGLKKRLKEKGVGRIAGKLACALTAFSQWGEEGEEGGKEETILGFSGSVMGQLKRVCMWLSVREFLLFLLILLPFGLVSWLFTSGLGAAVQVLVFALGGIFGWFLYTALVAPIIGLILQKKVFEAVSS